MDLEKAILILDMKIIFLILVMLSFAANVFADECEVTKVSLYQETKGGGSRETEFVSVKTFYCASYTIVNNASGGRFDLTMTATLGNGTVKTQKVKTPRIDAGGTYSDVICFEGAPIEALKCSW